MTMEARKHDDDSFQRQDDSHNSVVDDDDQEEEDEEDQIAFAAQAAAQALSENDDAIQNVGVVVDTLNPICCICGEGNQEGRPILRFAPVQWDRNTVQAAPDVTTFDQDLCLHIFCGKTAAIISKRPELEILTKAGLKNKHGIGLEVNAALARTRGSTLLETPVKLDLPNKAASSSLREKQYYLVREFEAHLARIRRAQISFVKDSNSFQQQPTFEHSPPPPPPPPPLLPPNAFDGSDLSLGSVHHVDSPVDYGTLFDTSGSFLSTAKLPFTASLPASKKQMSRKDGAGQTLKPTYLKPERPSLKLPTALQNQAPTVQLEQRSTRQQQQQAFIPLGAQVQSDGKIKCPCGSTHRSRGARDWKQHIQTKRHKKWLETQPGSILY